MTVVLLRLPKLEHYPDKRPRRCPYCNSQILQRWGRVTKPVTDRKDITAIIYRYRCKECERTFRHYPEGIDRSSYARGIRRLAALLWALGLSYRDIIEIFQKFEITLSRTTVWREGQEISKQLNGKTIQNHKQRYAIDKKYIHEASSKLGIVISIDIGFGEHIILGTLDEHNPARVQSWLEPLTKDTNIEIMQFNNDNYEREFSVTSL
jgi:transposase-like protein